MSRRARYSWSKPSWKRAQADLEIAEIDDPYDRTALGASDCGDRFNGLLVHLKRRGILRAKHVCCLAFWASGGGCRKADELSLRPDAGSGKFSRKFDSANKVDKSPCRFYELKVPGHFRGDHSRTVHKVDTVPAHESLEKEIRDTPDMAHRLELALQQELLPDCYYSHPVVVDAPVGVPVYPIAVYVDGLQYTRVDSVVAFYIYCPLTGRRHCPAVFRKADLCQCGCRGWRSMYPLLSQLHWSFLALARGKKPSLRHDNKPFDGVVDKVRASNGGQLLEFRACCLFLKADMMEYAPIFALPGPGSHINGCGLCHCTIEDMYDASELSAVRPPKRRKTNADYENAVQACEIKVVMDRRQFVKVRAVLENVRTDGGGRGRCIPIDFPELGLVRGDRLEPTPDMPDVAAFDLLEPPVKALFWRRSNETLVRHRVPLFSDETGISVPSCLVPDWMHGLSLGLIQDFLRWLLSSSFEHDVYLVGGFQEQRLVLSLNRFFLELVEWIKAEAKQKRFRTSVQQLTASMFGTIACCTLNLHAGEAQSMMRFVPVFLAKHGSRLPDLATASIAATAIIRCMDLMKLHPWVFPERAIEDFYP